MATKNLKPTTHDLNWALVAEAIRGDTYDRLDARAKDELLRETWKHTDAYGSVGLVPAQGWDWSGIRDSSEPAIAKIATVARRVLKRHGVVIPRAHLVAKATESMKRRAEIEAEMPELRKLGLNDTPSGLPPMGFAGGLGSGSPIPGFGANATPTERAEGDKIAAQNKRYWADENRYCVAMPGFVSSDFIGREAAEDFACALRAAVRAAGNDEVEIITLEEGRARKRAMVNKSRDSTSHPS